MITRMLAVSQKIFILMLVIAGVCACESKNEEDKFLDLLAHTEFNDEEISSIFSSDWKSITDAGVTFTFVKVEKFEHSYIVAKYISTKETAIFLGFIDDPFGNDGGIHLYTTGIVDDDISIDILKEVFGYNYHIGRIDSGITNLANWEVSSKSKNKKRLQEDGASNGWEHIKLTFKNDGSLFSERYQKYFEHKDGDFLAMIETDYSKFQVNISPVGNGIGDGISIDLDDGKAFSLLTGFVSLDSQTAKALIKKLESYVKIMKSKEGNSEQVKMAQEIINKAKKY